LDRSSVQTDFYSNVLVQVGYAYPSQTWQEKQITVFWRTAEIFYRQNTYKLCLVNQSFFRVFFRNFGIQRLLTEKVLLILTTETFIKHIQLLWLPKTAQLGL
jgi:hypothetical protein